jgi:hypothetical protein
MRSHARFDKAAMLNASPKRRWHGNATPVQ